MRDDWLGPNVAHVHEISQNKKFNVIREISYCVPVKPDSSCKIIITWNLQYRTKWIEQRCRLHCVRYVFVLVRNLWDLFFSAL